MIYDDKKFIGEVIRNARKRAGLLQSQLAEKVGMSDKNLGNIENGKQFPQVNNFLKLIEVLNLSLQDFGVSNRIYENIARSDLLQQIFVSTNREIEAFADVLTVIRKLSVV